MHESSRDVVVETVLFLDNVIRICHFEIYTNNLSSFVDINNASYIHREHRFLELRVDAPKFVL